jgi:electron transfer flavoprotein beta subunit
MNECDEYALDAALLWKKALGAELTAMTVGGIRSQDILYVALAKGADRAVRIDSDVNDSAVIARVLGEALQGKGYDLILTGVESEDNMASQVGVSLAERLGLPYAFAVTRVQFDGEQKRVQVVTELGGGIQEELDISLPAVLAIQSGIAALTYASLGKIMKARRMPVNSMGLRELNLERDALGRMRPKILEIFEPPKAGYAEMIEGSPQQMADILMDKVKHVLG